MKHVIKNNVCTKCGLSMNFIDAHKVKCKPKEEEIHQESRFKHNSATVATMESFLGFLDEFVNDALDVSKPKEESYLDSMVTILDQGEKDLLKIIADNPIPTGQLGVLDLPLEQIGMMLRFKKLKLIETAVLRDCLFWVITQTGLDQIEDKEPAPVLLSTVELSLLLSIYDEDYWDYNAIRRYAVRTEMDKLNQVGLVEHSSGKYFITSVGKAHVDKILALTV